MAGMATRLMIAAMAAAPLLAGSAEAKDCSEAETQAAMNECVAEEYKAADKALNAEYKKAQAGVTEDLQTALRDAQRAWIAFRDKACKVEGLQYAGGSIQPLIIAVCLTRLTRQRTEGLRQLEPSL